MIILGLYTMRKRNLTFRDLVQHGKNRVRRGPPPPPPPKYGMDNKQQYEEEYAYARKNSVNPLQPAAVLSRSGSLPRQTPLQPLGRSDRYVDIPFGFNHLARGHTPKSQIHLFVTITTKYADIT